MPQPIKVYLGQVPLFDAGQSSAGYNRPGDWLALPDMSATEGVAGLYAVGNHDSNFVAFTVAGAFDVDWGDGTTQSYASGATAEHNFDWADLSSTTLTSRGFRQAIIQITPQSGASITSLIFNVKHSTAGLVTGASTGWLDVEVNGPNCTNSQIFRTTNVIHRLLEQVIFRAVGSTSFQLMFTGCSALQSVLLFDTSNVTNMQSMFQSCSSLQSVPLFDTSNVTNMSGMFNGCPSLQSVPAFDTSKVTNMSSMFNGCPSLQSVPLFDTSNVTNFTSTLLGTALQNVPAFDMSAATTLLNTFLTNPSIARVEATGMKVSFTVANCSLSAAALNEIYTNLATVTGQTITVTGNYGTASDNPSIATAKGWTVTG